MGPDLARQLPRPDQLLNLELRDQIVTAHTRRRWGYRMIHDVLRPQYPGINHKRVYRIYTAEGLSIRKRKKARIGVRVPLVAAMALNQTWSWTSSVMRSLGRALYPDASNASQWPMTSRHECVDITADFGIMVPTSRGY